MNFKICEYAAKTRSIVRIENMNICFCKTLLNVFHWLRFHDVVILFVVVVELLNCYMTVRTLCNHFCEPRCSLIIQFIRIESIGIQKIDIILFRNSFLRCCILGICNVW